MPSPTIAVTGATGQVGSRVARSLAGRGVAQRLIVRDSSRAPVLPRAQVAVATYLDRVALASALHGIETVLFVSATEAPDRLQEHRAAIDAFVEAGVRRVVYTSLVGAAPDAEFTLGHDHYWTEQYLRDSGLASAIMRDALYQGLLPEMVANGVIKGPAGEGRFAPVAHDDVADTAVALLLDDSVTGTFEVTGPELLTMSDVAAILAEASGSPVSFVNETLEEAYEARSAFDVPQHELDAWVTCYASIAVGEMEVVSDAVQRLTGHSARTLRETLAAG